MQVIEAGVMIPGRGDPVPDAAIVLDGPTIAYAGPRAAAPGGTPADSISVPVVMPGMWDCHVHFFGYSSPDFRGLVEEPVATAAARATQDAAAALAAGFTSVREVGGLGVYLARAIDEGTVPGPHIYGSGGVLSQTGGHADFHALPLEWIQSMGREQPALSLCDGVPECLKAVRRQLRIGARVIKICASGGVMSELDHPIHQQFSDEELRAIVEEAARADRVVAAHCHGKPGIMAALRAGAATIEHGTYLDEEAAVKMREQGAVLVPTRFIIEQLLGMEDAVPSYAFRKAIAVADRHLEALQTAIRLGVTIAAGTDIFPSGPLWGRNAEELGHLVAAGMTPLQAIEAATANGPLTLGPQAPKSGRLVEGFDADLIALAASPLDDISVLADPANVTHVWKSGGLVKS